MALQKFSLTDKHVSLLRQLKWVEVGDTQPAHKLFTFGGDELLEDMALILYGPHLVQGPNDEAELKYSPEQEIEMKKLYTELPVAMDVVMFNGGFETGNFVTKSYVRDWKRI
jgi:hypothetical protein